MTTPTATRGPRRARLRVELLEDRRLCSVGVPATFNLGRPLTIQVLSDDAPGRALLMAPSVTVTISQTVNGLSRSVTLGTPLSSTRVDVNGDGIPDLVLKYPATDLKGFVAGQALVTVQGIEGGFLATSFHGFTLKGSLKGGSQNAFHHHKKHHPSHGTHPSPQMVQGSRSVSGGMA